MCSIKKWLIFFASLCASGCGLNSQKPPLATPVTYYQKLQQAEAIKNESRAHALGEAILQGYAANHKETLPPYINWQNNVKYYAEPEIQGEIGNYYYSKSLGGIKTSAIKDWANTKLLQSKVRGIDNRYIVVFVDGHTERQ